MSQPTAEQMQFSAAMNFMERMVGNVAREGANVMAQLEAAAQRIKALEAELAELKKPAEPPSA